MSIQDKITRLQTAKDNIADAITAKGGAVSEGDGFEEFSNDISSIPEGIQTEENYTVAEGKLTSASVQVIGDGITAHIPNNVTEIGNEAFLNDDTINTVIMSDSITSIESGVYQYEDSSGNTGAFYNCSNLKNVMFSNSLETIGNLAFGNYNPNVLVLPNSLTTISFNAFRNCKNLVSLSIPGGVTSIESQAFYNCKNLVSLSIPGSLETISARAFNACNSLTSLTIFNGVKYIADQAFGGCWVLPSLILPNSIVSIGSHAFGSCGALATLTLPASLQSIGENCFSGCDSLTDIYYPGTQQEYEAITGINNCGFKGTETIHYNYTPAE